MLILPALSSAAPISGFVDVADACTGVGCFGGEQTFGITASAPVSGSLSLNSGASTLSFSFSVTSLVLAETVAGSEDNGVAQIVFSSTTYATTGPLSVSGVGGTFVIDPGQTASVSGTQSQLDDLSGNVNGTPSAFAAPSASVSGSCIDNGAGIFTCGLTFGTVGFSLQVGDPGSGLTPQTRFLRHTANVVTPEPGTWALLGLGLAGLAFARRSSA